MFHDAALWKYPKGRKGLPALQKGGNLATDGCSVHMKCMQGAPELTLSYARARTRTQTHHYRLIYFHFLLAIDTPNPFFVALQ